MTMTEEEAWCLPKVKGCVDWSDELQAASFLLRAGVRRWAVAGRLLFKGPGNCASLFYVIHNCESNERHDFEGRVVESKCTGRMR